MAIKTVPRVVARVCTEIQIRKSLTHGDEYIKRKGLSSLKVPAACNFNETFFSIGCFWAGSVHDLRRNSDLLRVMREQESRCLLLVDEGYGLAP